MPTSHKYFSRVQTSFSKSFNVLASASEVAGAWGPARAAVMSGITAPLTKISAMPSWARGLGCCPNTHHAPKAAMSGELEAAAATSGARPTW